MSPADSALEGMARPLPEAPTGRQEQTFKDTHSEYVETPQDAKKAGKKLTKPEGPKAAPHAIKLAI